MEGTCGNSLAGSSVNTFMTLLNYLSAARCDLDPKNHYVDSSFVRVRHDDEYDFVMVGGGSAGCAVASRLSENPKWKVLLVEAGGLPTSDSEIPGLWVTMWHTDKDWEFSTEPSKTSCLGTIKGRCYIAAGKFLGGSSSINGMIYLRGNKRDFQKWVRAGCDGWDWNNVTHYYKKSENVHGDLHNNGWHGTSGPLNTSQYQDSRKLYSFILKVANESNVKFSSDSVVDPLGWMVSLSTIWNGTRQSSSKAYLSKVTKRPNLHIALKSKAQKILLRGNTAYGVLINVGKKFVVVKARKEVIISAGTINTPKLLMLSGIGHARHLRKIGVKPIVHLKGVGSNFQEHMIAQVFVQLDASIAGTPNPNQQILDSFQYFSQRTGPLAGTGTTNIFYFFSTQPSSYPDIQTFFFMYPPKTFSDIDNLYWLDNTTAKSLAEANKNHALLLLGVILVNPKSRGQVLLRSNDSAEDPKIVPRFFTNKEDVKTLIKGVRVVEKLLSTPIMRKYNATLLDYEIPGCKGLNFDTDDYWECNFRNVALLGFHPVGTCRMGSSSDSSTVLDAKLKVLGVNRLRVVDASVMPYIVSSNTNAASIMIGEKGADIIKHDHGYFE